ncbi:MAG: metal ABC transporter substrate-binding protein [Cyanobacteriota bacterium]|jgi:zinc transport system substrate-binding protein
MAQFPRIPGRGPSSRAIRWSALLCLLLVALGGCGRSGPGVPSRSRLRVLTTVLPMTLFTTAVAEGCAEVEPLFPVTADPHEAQASPADLARLARADVLVRNGLGLDASVDRFLENADRRLRVIDAGGPLLPQLSRESAAGPVNPHVWLDPLLAVRQVELIRDGLIAADPPCQQRYRANAAAFRSRLLALDGELRRQLAPYAGRRFVVFHSIAPYFSERYRLRSVALVPGPEQEPSPADLQRVSQVVRAEGLKALLAEPPGSAGALAALARDLKVEVLIFDPLEISPGSGSGLLPDYYLETMRRNGRQLVRSFGGTAAG